MKLSTVSGVLAITSTILSTSASAAKVSSFKSDILPIFEQHCLVCHGSDPPQGDLDLRSVATLLKGGKSGQAVTANSAEHSLLLEKIVSGSMPPVPSKLTSDQIDQIREWINVGLSKEPTVLERIVTEKDVLPIFQLRCAKCHGKRRREGELDLRTLDTRIKGGKSGPALIPGKPAQSLLFQKITNGEMPPPDLLFSDQVRPLTETEVETLKKWIVQGAHPDTPDSNPSALSSMVDKPTFWAFLAPKQVKPPKIQHTEKVQNPIDAFVLQKLQEKNLTLSPKADKKKLMRRAYIDLIGMPPTPEEANTFLADKSPDAYERLIGQLLESPHYGEKWAQMWLDLAGYADSEGVVEEDRLRLHAWRYRDYVIRAFNMDKPYDRFLLEQLAGDELIDHENVQEITQETVDTLAATGFLRLTPDGTYASATGSIEEIMTVVADEIHVLSSAIMGLTIGCARCHDHKYDPIPQKDYYRLGAIFQTALDPYDWLDPTERFFDVGMESEKKHARKFNLPIQKEIEKKWTVFRSIVDPHWKRKLEAQISEVPQKIQNDLRTIAYKLKEQRKGAIVNLTSLSSKEKSLVNEFRAVLQVPNSNGEWHQIAEAFPEIKEEAGQIHREITKLETELWPTPKIRGLYDMGGAPSPVYLLNRGDAKSLGDRVYPDVPQLFSGDLKPFKILSSRPDRTSGNRLAFARWLTQPHHPLTSRVIVNRIWLNYFGRGLVETPANFGHTGSKPSHPELLDWLATKFVNNDWSLKALHRLIMTSSTYQQTSLVSSDAYVADPKNILLSRMPLRRMNAEMLHDSILRVTERIDLRQFGRPVAVTKQDNGEITPNKSKDGWRRAIYSLKKRRMPMTILEVFDAPQLSPNCTERSDSTVALQALHLANSDLLQHHARFLAGRLVENHPADIDGQINAAYKYVLARSATQNELSEATLDFSKLAQHWHAHFQNTNYEGPRPMAAHWMALGSLIHTLLNAPEFVYID